MKLEPSRRLRRTVFSLLVLSLFVLFAFPAFAQTTSQPPVVSVLSVPLAVIALLGLFSAYVAQGATTGSVLGLFTISPKAIPYLSVVGTFFATLVTQLSIAAAANALTGAAVFNAIVAAFYMLVAPATGSAIRHHIDTPKVREEIIAASIRPPPPPKVPPAVVGAMLVTFAFVLLGCNTPLWQQIETTVETDLKSGVLLSDIETAVAALDPALASIAGAVDVAIQDIINYLVANGSLTAAQLANAESVKVEIKAKLAKLSAVDRAVLKDRRSEFVVSPEVVRLVASELAR